MRLPSLRSWRFQRDTVIWVVAIGLLIYEATVGGGRPPVLTAVVTLLVSPFAIRADETRKKDEGA